MDLEKAKHSIQLFCKLPSNWDSYGAKPVDKQSFNNAIAFLKDLEKVYPNIPHPHIFPTSSGGVQFEWDSPLFEIEIEIQPIDEVKVLCVMHDKGKEHYNEFTFEHNFKIV